MPPIQEHGYEGGYGYDDADWDGGGGGRAWGRQDGWDVHPSQRGQERMYDDRRQQPPQEIIGVPQHQHNHNHAGYVASAAAVPHNGVYDRYDNTAVTPSRISYAGRTVLPVAGLPAPDWPPSRHIAPHAAANAAGVAGYTTPPRHLRKLPQIPKPAEITQKLQQQKQLMANNIRCDSRTQQSYVAFFTSASSTATTPCQTTSLTTSRRWRRCSSSSGRP